MVLLSGSQEETARAISLEELVAEIKQMPPNPTNITPASGYLSKKLAYPLTEIDPEFDLDAWTKAWDRIESATKALALAHEAEELRKVWAFMYTHHQNQQHE